MEAVDASGCDINYQGLDNLREWGGRQGLSKALAFIHSRLTRAVNFSLQ